MHEGISASIAFTLFLLLTTATFLFLTNYWTEQSLVTVQANERQQARLETAIAINEALEPGLDCDSFHAQVDNTGAVGFADFSEMDLIVEYTDASGAKVAAWLQYGTDWSVDSISPDTRDPNILNPGETATVSFTLPSAMKAIEKGTVLVSSPLAVSDSKYFSCVPDPPTFSSGSYVGTGAPGKAITGVGFQPDVVIVKGDAAQAPVIRTSSMTGDNSKPLLKTALASDHIQSLDSDGFTVGGHDRVNGNGITYYWSAFKAGGALATVDSYVGNGSNQSITGVGFSPEIVIVMSSSNDEANIKTADMPGQLAMQLDDEDGRTNRITSLDSDGFTVGGSGQANRDGTTYHYIAWNAVVGETALGSYQGNNTDNRSITGVGFQPQYVIVKSQDGIQGVHHPWSLGASTDDTLSFMAEANFSDGIQALQSDGFQIGAGNTVNQNSTTYYWVAFGPGQ